MPPYSQKFDFNKQANSAINDPALRQALNRASGGFIKKRKVAIDALEEFSEMKTAAKQIKQHTLANLDKYLTQFEENQVENGGQVHWALNASQANSVIIDICNKAKAKKIIKGKSMVSEEIALNENLIEKGFDVIESDLGEYIIQLANEKPSHIIAPAVHKTKEQIIELFKEKHTQFNPSRNLDNIADIVNEAAEVMRMHFCTADVGITGANFLIAETGSTVLVTNEGNGDLASTLPKVHIVITSIEKVVPRLEDASLLIRLLDRSATGQHLSNYTSFFSGPKRQNDLDGPNEYHVVLLDNGRSDLLNSEFLPMLHCIRCGACINHCPVYKAVGGHSYGWVYPGPMGAVLTPLMDGLKENKNLPNACTLNGRCQEVCPMSIPLPSMLRKLRMRLVEENLVNARSRLTLKLWYWLTLRPKLYHRIVNTMMSLISLVSRKGHFKRFIFARGWTSVRDLPAPQGKTFIKQYAKLKKHND